MEGIVITGWGMLNGISKKDNFETNVEKFSTGFYNRHDINVLTEKIIIQQVDNKN